MVTSWNGRFLKLFFLLFLACQFPLLAQEAATTGPEQNPGFGLGQVAGNIWADQKAIWTSPVHMNSRQWLTIGAPIIAVTSALIVTDKDSSTLLRNTPGQIRWSGRVSEVGAFYSLGGFSAGAILAGKFTKQPRILRMGQRSAEALASAAIVSAVIKGAAARERPDENDGDGRFWKGGDSFPSGHSMGTWAIATSIARSRDCPKWLAVVSYGVAGAVGLSRWGAKKHFPSDVVVGSVFGWFIGNRVARRPR